MKTKPTSGDLHNFAAITFMATALAVDAAEIGIQYSGSSGGNWSSAGNWTPAIVPNNGTDLYNVTVPSPRAVIIDGAFTIRSLDLDAGGSATLSPGRSLTLSAGAVVDGVLNMGAPGNFNASRIYLTADMTFGGSGAMELRGVPVIESAAGSRLTVGPDLTLHWLGTSGGFGGSSGIGITNQGEIDFEGAGNNNFNHTESDLRNSGVFNVRNNSNVSIYPVGNHILFDNTGTVVVDGGRLDLEGVSMKNTDTIEVRNNGIFEISQDIDNTGGILRLESGGKLSPVNFFGLTLTGGSISGVGGIIEPQGSVTLQGGPANDTLEISGTSVVTSPGNTVQLSGDIHLADGAAFSGNGIRISGNTSVTGTGSFPLQLSGSTGNDSLTLGNSLILTTGAGAGAVSLSVKTTQTAGPVNVDSTDFTIVSGCTLTSTGATHLFPNTILTATGNFSSVGGTVQLDSGSRLGGGIVLNGSTVSGAGTIRPTSLGLAGTNVIGTPIETGTTTVTVTGGAQVGGSGALRVNQGSSGTTSLNAAAIGHTLTTGTDFDVSVTSNHTLTVNLPWNFQGQADVNGGVMVIASDFDNDGVIDLTGNAQLQVNKSILSTSTGSINAASGTTVTVNGASQLGGALSGNGLFTFSGTVPVMAADYTGQGTLTLNNGANVSFSQPVQNIPAITVNSNNAKLHFNGGLEGFGTATVTGSGGVFNVTGNSTATGLFQIRSGATHGGAGTTTAQGNLEIDGKLNGRTLIAENPTTARQINMSNNALFVNKDIFSFFTFGPPAAVSGVGVLRNEGTLTQADDPFGGSIPTNTVSTDYQQTSTGILAPKTEIALTGDSEIAGTATIPDGGNLTLGSGAADTTHSVTGGISGGGMLKISGNTGTGAAPTTTISGTVNLSGPNSGTEIRDGATLRISGGPAAPVLGRRVQILNEVQIEILENSFGPFIIALLEYGVADIRGPVPAPGEQRQEISVEQLTAMPNDLPGARIENIDLIVTDSCGTNGLTDWINSKFETGPGCTATLNDGTQLTSTTGNGACENSGGTWLIPAFAQVEISNQLPFQDHEGNTSVREHGELAINGTVVSTTSTFEVFQGGTLAFNGPSALIGATITAKAGSGLNPGGTVTVADVEEMRDCTFTAGNDANIQITLPVDNTDRSLVENNEFLLDNERPHFSILHIFFENSQTELSGRGRMTLEELRNLATSPGGAGSTGPSLIMSPGSSAGHFEITGNLPLGSGSGITLELGGTTQSSQYDLLSVDGVLSATHTALRPLFINSFQNSITPTDTFTVIETTQPIIGTFSNVFGGRVMVADGTGSFSVTMAAGNTRVILGDFLPDTDRDGMPDNFEQEHFGHPTAGNPTGDKDNDGQTNLAEYTAGTNPTDSASVLRITNVRRQGNDVVISFVAAPNKAYRIEAGTTLADSFPLFIQNVAATPLGGTRQVTHTGGGSLPARFYRAVTPPPP